MSRDAAYAGAARSARPLACLPSGHSDRALEGIAARPPLRVVHTLAAGRSLVAGRIAGMIEDLETGEVAPLTRAPAATYGEVVDAWPASARPDAAAAWQDTVGAPSRTMPRQVADRIESARKSGATPWEAWAHAWVIDATALRAAAAACGTATIETTYADGTRQYHLQRCKTVRCPHCSHIIGLSWRDRIRDALGAVARKGDPAWLLTLTIDRKKWARSRNIAPDIAAGVMAQRWITREWERAWRKLRRAYPGTEALRVVEPHRDGWPHLHIILVGNLAAAAQKEARKKTGVSGVKIAAWAIKQRELQRRGKIRIAKAPAPITRRSIREIIAPDDNDNYWGRKRFYLQPIMLTAQSIEYLARYLSKGAHVGPRPGAAAPIEHGAAGIARETAKAGHRRVVLLARGVRVWQDTRGFAPRKMAIAADCDEDCQPVARCVLPVSIQEVRRACRDAGGWVRGEVHTVIFGDPQPDRAALRRLSSITSNASWYGMTAALCATHAPAVDLLDTPYAAVRAHRVAAAARYSSSWVSWDADDAGDAGDGSNSASNAASVASRSASGNDPSHARIPGAAARIIDDGSAASVA